MMARHRRHSCMAWILIGQDDGTGMRLLLADGLGSVRQEMVGGAVAATTTYDPYGKLLAQSGTSGTVYGYTGEQEDAATGLVYLRARYYNPNTNHFLTRDPWRGNMRYPKTLTAYPYMFMGILCGLMTPQDCNAMTRRKHGVHLFCQVAELLKLKHPQGELLLGIRVSIICHLI